MRPLPQNAASEFMGLIKGEYGGRSDDFLPGGASYECGHVPHGVDNDVFEAASNIEQNGAQWISDGCYVSLPPRTTLALDPSLTFLFDFSSLSGFHVRI